jgi:hypothetical protein
MFFRAYHDSDSVSELSDPQVVKWESLHAGAALKSSKWGKGSWDGVVTAHT